MPSGTDQTKTDLIAVIVAVTDDEPRVLTIEKGRALPSGPFLTSDRSLQASLRTWVERQTHHPLGYVEQLYTFADRDRLDDGRHAISISYLGLTREALSVAHGSAAWIGWYRFFPWEEQRQGGDLVRKEIAPRLKEWAARAPDKASRALRQQRIATVFGDASRGWNEEFVLQRYELLWEAGLVPESPAAARGATLPLPGQLMLSDNRRILATGIARLRVKLKYRPVIFELMPESFTFLQLQRTVEAIVGRLLHKQNFRRMIEQQDLIEDIGESMTETGGRPAKLLRYKREVVLERAVMGSKLPLARSR